MMEAYPNQRWRESNRLPPTYYPHPPPPSSRLPEERHWQRTSPVGSSGHWDQHNPNSDPWQRNHPSLLPVPENGYSRVSRKEREFIRAGPPSDHTTAWLDSTTEGRRGFSFARRRPEGFQHNFNAPHFHNRSAHHDYLMTRNPVNYSDHSFQLTDGSHSPAYSDPTSSPDTRSWDSERESQRDPRLRPHPNRHISCDDSSHRRDHPLPPHRVNLRPHTPPIRDSYYSYRSYRIPSYANRKDRSLDEDYSRSTSHDHSSRSVAGSIPKCNEESIVSSVETVKEKDCTSSSCDESNSLKVFKNVLHKQIMVEHSYTKASTSYKPATDNIPSLTTDSISTSPVSTTVTSILSSERSKGENDVIVSLMDDSESDCDSLIDFNIDLDTDPESFSNASSPLSETSTIMTVSIPLSILNKLVQSVDPLSNNSDIIQQERQRVSSYQLNEVENSESSKLTLADKEITNKCTNENNSRKRLHHFLSSVEDEDSCSTTSSHESGRSKKTKPFQDFIPEILETRSRAETATVRRRYSMEKEIERNEINQQTSVSLLEDMESLSFSPSLCLDDSSSTISVSSEHQENFTEEFSQEFILRCKRRYANRLIGSGDSTLHKVCRTGRLKTARYFILVEQHKVDTQDNAGWTPLHEACNNNFPDIVRVLLENGADPNLPSYDGSRPIHDAIEAGSLSIVRLLVNYGADVMVEQGEETPLELARRLDQLNIVMHLEGVIQERIKRNMVRKNHVISASLTMKRSVIPSASKPVIHSHVMLPFDGYTEPMFGPELDSPVVHLSATIEQSHIPFLPVYNIQVSTGSNPRKHNFHLLSDVIKCLSVSSDVLLAQLHVKTHTLSVGNFLQQLLSNPLTRYAAIIEELQDVDIASTIELVPLCNLLKRMFDIQVANIDDY